MLTEFIQGKEYEILDYETLKCMEGIESSDEDSLCPGGDFNVYLKEMDKLGGQTFMADDEYIFYKYDGGNRYSIRPWMCKLSEVGEIGRTYVDEKVRELTLLYLQKNHDYGNSVGITRGVLGVDSDLVRMADKINRIKTLQTKEGFVSEKVEDTIFDLVNYYAIYKAYQLDNTLLSFVTSLERALLNPENMLYDLEDKLSTVILDENTYNFIKDFITNYC